MRLFEFWLYIWVGSICYRARYVETVIRALIYASFSPFLIRNSHTFCPYDAFLVTADADLPRPMKVSVTKTLPSVSSVGTQVYSAEVSDICQSGSIIAYPDGDDGVQTCPGAGLYNFNFVYENFGTRQSWFAGWSGYSFGMALHIKHEGGGSDYATCYINVHAATGSDDSYATNATFVSIATLGLAGLCVSMFVRRRKERLASKDHESEERRKELATNFELVQDSPSTVV
jgi:hypothetical protein